MEDSLRSHLITRERGLPCIIKACRVRFVAAVSALNIMAPGLSGARTFFFIRFSVATLFRFVARFARGMITPLVSTGSCSTAFHKLPARLFLGITRKIKIGNLVFLFIQLIPDLSCKFDHF